MRDFLSGALASLLGAAFSALQVSVNLQFWVLTLLAIAIAGGGYILFEITLAVITSAEDREKEWLKRVGTPARLELIEAWRAAAFARRRGREDHKPRQQLHGLVLRSFIRVDAKLRSCNVLLKQGSLRRIRESSVAPKIPRVSGTIDFRVGTAS